MKKLNVLRRKAIKAFAFPLLAVLFPQVIQAQNIMFDDFTYSGVNELVNPGTASNRWSVVNGQSGPPEGAMYSSNNIEFITDPTNPNNRLMKVSTTVNGQTRAIVNSRIESAYEYFEGTYASRVYISDEAFGTKDGNIQTYFTIVPSSLAQDGTKYSEMDIVEYMAADKWGVSPNNQVLYTTSYHKYIANPWKPWKTYTAQRQSYAGWHTFMAVCTDKVNIRYYIDGNLIATHSVTDNETQAGLPVYPRSTMHIAYANWIAANDLGPSTANRTNTMQVDWTLHYKNTALTPAEVTALVNSYRASGLQRRNMAGQTYSTGVSNQAPQIQLTAPANGTGYTAPASINITANASDADGSVAKVEFYNGGALIGTDNSSPYAFNWTNVAAGTYSITAKATDNLGLTTTTPAVSVTVSPVAVTQSPYKGSPIAIPGVVELEDYDFGGQGVAFNETTTANQGGAYRTAEPIDIEATTGGGFNVGYVVTDEWMEYTVNVTSAGAYNIEARVATTAAGKTFRLELGGTTIANFTLPNTTAWQTWQTVTVSNVSLTAGQKVLRLYATSTDFNIDRLTFSKVVVSNQPPTVSLTAPANNATYTAPASINITANAADADGTISKVEFFNGAASLGSDATAPYTFSWNGVAAGTYTITAKATDNAGAVTTSSAATVVVNPVVSTGPVSVYQNCNNDPGYVIALPVGTYTTAQLVALGIKNNDISRITVQAGYQVTLYNDDNLAGTSHTATGNVDCLTSVNFNDLTSSIKVSLVVVNNQTPYAGIFGTIPGTIEAEKYDLGGQGIAFNDVTTANEGGAFRTDAVDIEPLGTGYDVGYIVAGEWLEYTVNVTAGSYRIDAHVAAIAAGKTFRLELDGATIATFTVPNTGAWGTFQVATVNNVTVTAGQKVLRLYATTSDFNVDKIIFSAATTTPNVAPTISLTAPANNTTLSAPASIAITANASDSDGSVSKVEFYNGTQKLGEDLTAPYAYTWTSVAAGTYTITAKATDNAGATTTTAVSTVTVNAVNADCYSLVWSDEFDQPTLNSSNWNVEVNNFGGYNNELQYYTNRPENVRIENGNLVIEARKETYLGREYTSGRLNSSNKKSWQYGKIEAKMKLPYGNGMWPAFWMMGNSGNWPANGEIDIMELVGGNKCGSECGDNKTHGYAWWSDNGDKSAGTQAPILASGKYADDYHVFAVEWTATSIKWSIDGNVFYTLNTSSAAMSEFQQPFYLLLNVAVGGDWPGSPDASTVFPQKMLVEYVRVYQKTSASCSEGNNNTSGGTCAAISEYKENNGYVAGSKVKLDGKQYECKPFPYSGWCNGAAWAYQPGTGAYWADAWTLIGNCNSAARTEASATVNDALLTNAPNPFSVITSVSLETAEAGEVTVAVYNKNGQLIQTLAQGYLTAGSHEFVFDASALQADIYLIKCNTPNGVITRKIVKTE
jgi:beta-glucanase (GH16 family)